MPVSSSTSFTATSAGRVADVGPPGRVQPDAGVGALHQQDLTVVVADHRADRHLRRDVAGHALADRLHPLLDEVVGLAAHLEGLVGRRLDVGGDLQHLLVALPLVEALGEAQPGAGDAGRATRSSGARSRVKSVVPRADGTSSTASACCSGTGSSTMGRG